MRRYFSQSARRHGLPVAVFGLLISCYLVVSAPAAKELGGPTRRLLVLGAVLVPPAFSWMMLELLTDPPVRLWPWLLLAAASVVISLIEATGADSDLPGFAYLLQAGSFWVLALLFAWQTLRPDADLTAPPASPPSLVRSELIDLLDGRMVQGLWRRKGLTIRALADDLAVPEHRLRQAINQELGHRNFSTFINSHRKAAAKSVLADPARARVSILEIALTADFPLWVRSTRHSAPRPVKARGIFAPIPVDSRNLAQFPRKPVPLRNRRECRPLVGSNS